MHYWDRNARGEKLDRVGPGAGVAGGAAVDVGEVDRSECGVGTSAHLDRLVMGMASRGWEGVRCGMVVEQFVCVFFCFFLGRLFF